MYSQLKRNYGNEFNTTDGIIDSGNVFRSRHGLTNAAYLAFSND